MPEFTLAEPKAKLEVALLVLYSQFIVRITLFEHLENSITTLYLPNNNTIILALPHFTRVPSDQTAWEGEALSFPCEAEGSPKPLIFWTMEGSQVPSKPTPLCYFNLS